MSVGECVQLDRANCPDPHLICISSAPANKSEKEIHNEIQGIIRQITASVTFLPVIDTPCASPAV